jgi:hypothetical protein
MVSTSAGAMQQYCFAAISFAAIQMVITILPNEQQQ